MRIDPHVDVAGRQSVGAAVLKANGSAFADPGTVSAWL